MLLVSTRLPILAEKLLTFLHLALLAHPLGHTRTGSNPVSPAISWGACFKVKLRILNPGTVGSIPTRPTIYGSTIFGL